MNILKSILRMIIGLIAGGITGLALSGIGLICFTDISFAEFMSKLQAVSFSESILVATTGIVAFCLSLVILIPIHEAGHLVLGLLSGYKFVSFRIFSLTLIKTDGRLRIKRYAIAGTGGQCLLTPPERPLKEIPTVLYNIGGVLANLITVLLVLPLLWISGQHPVFYEATVIFILTGIILIAMNGIPIKINGVGNDAHNMLSIRKNQQSKRGFIMALRANALIQNGVRPKDMPSEWFAEDFNIDYRNQLEISLPIMTASRLIDEMKYAEALHRFEELYTHKSDIIGLYVKEIECELVFLRLVNGDVAGARLLFDDKLRKYIKTYRKVMSSKERILCTVYLIMEDDRNKAIEIYNSLLARKGDYLLQGEVDSDLSIMQTMLCL